MSDNMDMPQDFSGMIEHHTVQQPTRPELIAPAELVRVPFGFLENVKETLNMIERYLYLQDLARCQLNFFDPAKTISPLTRLSQETLAKTKAIVSDVIVARYNGDDDVEEEIPLPELPELPDNPLGQFTGFRRRPPVTVDLPEDEVDDA